MSSTSVRLTVAQALVRFLAAQHVARDGERRPFFAGCFGIFGHGNVAGLGEALQHQDGLRFRQARNEQAMVHIAAGYARQSNRLGTFACTSSVGPGATNMVTGAALATINRLPVLLLPGDVFATRRADPVLQQLERLDDGTVSVNDAFRPVSRYFDRIERPEQLIDAALEAVRVLTDPAETGAVTLALPEDVQVEALDVPAAFLAPRTWNVWRNRPAQSAIVHAAALIRAAKRPLIVAGGGVIYSEAGAALTALVDAAGIPVCETQAGRGSLHSDHGLALGAVGATGSRAANNMARDADLVIGIGTRWTDFTTSSRTAFRDPAVRFVTINVAAFDGAKQGALALVGDARATIEELSGSLAGYRCDEEWMRRALGESEAWSREVARLTGATTEAPLRQAEVIGAVNDAAGEDGIVVCAAGSAPGDLHKLWRARHAKSYHVEYGYSCMGYEIPGGIGVKLAAPERRVFVLVGDGSYLMLPGELATAVAEEVDLTIVLLDNHGYASIGGLSRSLGQAEFGTHERVPLDLGANAESLGATVLRPRSIEELEQALRSTSDVKGPVVLHVEVDRYATVPSYEGWWDVPVAETSVLAGVEVARRRHAEERLSQRTHLEQP